jgi:hypothetical protein
LITDFIDFEGFSEETRNNFGLVNQGVRIPVRALRAPGHENPVAESKNFLENNVDIPKVQIPPGPNLRAKIKQNQKNNRVGLGSHPNKDLNQEKEITREVNRSGVQIPQDPLNFSNGNR